ncbi:evolutionarily conserved signaling intermediate in Toll pathway, mitochondrial-like [Babylonia areolata]|uniref:evolutionarily conserved signaling intermediate in Toll pathway, mitochondrial-like n=1 Tax=Babylonia areolata TaxID=304850 RepID=UPI003FD16DE4
MAFVHAVCRNVPRCCQLMLRQTQCRTWTCALVGKRFVHSSPHLSGRDDRSLETTKHLIAKSAGMFEELAMKRTADKLTFCSALEMYVAKEKVYRRGHVEFIYAAMENMEKFGVHRDLAVYKALLEVFPKKKMVPRSAWQVEFMHFPKQQQCAIDLMDQMEDYGVIPDHDFGMRLQTVFGTDAHAFRKYRRMMYWMPKFKHANPYPVPKELPDDALALAILALQRMAVDRENKITVWNSTNEDMEAKEDTFIASAQCTVQQELIRKHDPQKPLFVEGGYTCWLRHKSAMYFILRADPDLELHERVKQAEEDMKNDTHLFEWRSFLDEEDGGQLVPQRSVHEQDDGTVLAMAITGTATKDSLVTWIRCLQQANPALEHIPVVFRLRTPESEIQVIGSKRPEAGVQTVEV